MADGGNHVFGLPLVKGDSLVLVANTALINFDIRFVGRYLDEDGRPNSFENRLRPTTSNTRIAGRRSFNGGVLLSLTAISDGTTVRRGQTFVSAFISRDRVNDDVPSYPLLSGYLADGSLLSWPGSPLLPSVEGRGSLRAVTISDPGVGVVFAHSMNAGVRWKVLSLFIRFVTSAVAGNRHVGVGVESAGSNRVQYMAAGLQAASLTVDYTAAAFGAGPGVVGTRNFIPLPPDLWLGHQMGSNVLLEGVVDGMDAGDDFSLAHLLVEEYIED